MKDYVKKVKNHWNSVSDSDWYMSLRTNEQILKLQENPAFAFHPAVFELIKKYAPLMSPLLSSVSTTLVYRGYT